MIVESPGGYVPFPMLPAREQVALACFACRPPTRRPHPGDRRTSRLLAGPTGGGRRATQVSETAAVATWADDAAARLLASGYREVPASLAERHARAFRRRDFRLRWFATALHTFVVLAEAPTADVASVRGYVDDAVRWAKKAKGGLPRGMQTGVAVLPVLAVGSADQEARREASRRPDKEFAALRLPVLVEIVPGVVSTYSGAMVWGMVYTDFLGDQQRLVAGELPVDVLKPGGERRSLRWAVVAGASGAVVGMVLLLVLLFLL